jgi:hypothetical protein
VSVAAVSLDAHVTCDAEVYKPSLNGTMLVSTPFGGFLVPIGIVDRPWWLRIVAR